MDGPTFLAYMPASPPHRSVLVSGQSHFRQFLSKTDPAVAACAPKACVGATQFLVGCHQPSHMVPMANGWANFLGLHASFASTQVRLWLRSVSFLTILEQN